MRLRAGQCLKLRADSGHGVLCCAGRIWITQENDRRDVFLEAGEKFVFGGKGMALISAEAGMKDEWLQDTGVAVIALYNSSVHES